MSGRTRLAILPPMETQERRHFFERICELRGRYAALGEMDRIGTTSLDEAVALMAAALAVQADALKPEAEPAQGRADYLN